MSCPINKCGFSAQEKGCGKARSAGNTLPQKPRDATSHGTGPQPFSCAPFGSGHNRRRTFLRGCPSRLLAEGSVAALGNMPDIPCGLRLAVGDCAHSESHLFMGQDTRSLRPNTPPHPFQTRAPPRVLRPFPSPHPSHRRAQSPPPAPRSSESRGRCGESQ